MPYSLLASRLPRPHFTAQCTRRHASYVHTYPLLTSLIALPLCRSHALDKPQTEYEQWLNVAWWLKRFI